MAKSLNKVLRQSTVGKIYDPDPGIVLFISSSEYISSPRGSLVNISSLYKPNYVTGSDNSIYLVVITMEISQIKEILAFPSLPHFVCNIHTPFAPRAPYKSVAVASFMNEKLVISTGLSWAKSVAV